MEPASFKTSYIQSAGIRFHKYFRKVLYWRAGNGDLPWRPHPKTYERMEQIQLPSVSSKHDSLLKALHERESCRDFSHRRPTFEEVAFVVRHAAGLRGESSIRRTHPSSGGLYPVEVYIAAYEVEGLEPYVYHYNVAANTFEKLFAIPHDTPRPMHEEEIQEAPVYIYLTATWLENEEKYRDYCYPLALVETGHIAQNLALVAEAMGLTGISTMGYYERQVESLLGIDPERETLLYAFVLGCKRSTEAHE